MIPFQFFRNCAIKCHKSSRWAHCTRIGCEFGCPRSKIFWWMSTPSRRKWKILLLPRVVVKMGKMSRECQQRRRRRNPIRILWHRSMAGFDGVCWRYWVNAHWTKRSMGMLLRHWVAVSMSCWWIMRVSVTLLKNFLSVNCCWFATNQKCNGCGHLRFEQPVISHMAKFTCWKNLSLLAIYYLKKRHLLLTDLDYIDCVFFGDLLLATDATEFPVNLFFWIERALSGACCHYLLHTWLHHWTAQLILIFEPRQHVPLSHFSILSQYQIMPF